MPLNAAMPVAPQADQAAPDLLDARRIERALDGQPGFGGLRVLGEVDSTNQWLLERAGLPTGFVCIAERQHHGRGRRGREWVSPYGVNLYLSTLWHFTHASPALAGLSLALGVAVAEALERLGARGVGLKWPNDLVAGGAKLGGILVEAVSQPRTGRITAVSGVGVDVDMPAPAGARIDRHWVNLRALGGVGSRSEVAAAVTSSVLAVLARFGCDGLAPFLERFARLDCLRGREVQVFGGSAIAGVASGVEPDGALLVRSGSELHRVCSSEVSVRLGAGAGDGGTSR